MDRFGQDLRTPLAASLWLCLTCVSALRAAQGAPPRRVVSLVPAATELVEALGAGDRLVGVGRDDEEASRWQVPRLGGPADPALEAIAALEPDLVVAWEGITGPVALARFRTLGARVYLVRIETLADIERTARGLGRLLGRFAAGDSVARSIAGTFDSIRSRPTAARGVRPSVAFVLHGRSPFLSAGPGTYLDEVVRTAGGRNAFGNAPVRWPRVSAEALAARRPDVLVLAEEEAAGFLERGPWRGLPAVRNEWILRVPRARLLHPGP
ncbi:MAG TPA: helical backbone metal receptor, partial [Longimicrobiales bacterium]|nr:helical backbone metal receptor [Longimicrobiales bacterium]